MSTVSDDVSLATGDGVDHLFGGGVEVHGNLLRFIGVGLSLEPISPLMGVLGDVLPVHREVDVSIVVAWVLNINSLFSGMSLESFDIAVLMEISQLVLFMVGSLQFGWITTLPIVILSWFRCLPAIRIAAILHVPYLIVEIVVSALNLIARG